MNPEAGNAPEIPDIEQILKAAAEAGNPFPPRLMNWQKFLQDDCNEPERVLWLRLNAYLTATVPVHIAALDILGGPTEWEFTRATRLAGKEWVSIGADDLVYNPKRKQHDRLFSLTAEAVAVMAFVPGGIKVFGLEFAAGPLNGKKAK